MERMTKKEMLAGHEVHYVSGDDCFGVWSVPKKFMGAAIDLLAAYEDTGLEPGEVTAIKSALMGREIAKITEFDGIPIQRLQELAQAEKDGRLVVLPCKVDTPPNDPLTLEELREMADEIADDFISFVTGGVQNAAPYCANMRAECCERPNWCTGYSKACKGFYPKAYRSKPEEGTT